MAEECAAVGYAETTVAGVAKRAGVSTASFYRQFRDRRECMLASFEELFGRLLEVVEQGCGGAGDRAREGIGTAAQLLSSDLPTARLLTIEIAGVGAEGVRLQQGAIERLAALLRGVGGAPGDGPVAFPSGEWIAVSAMVSLVAKRVAAGEGPTAEELEGIYDATLAR